MMQSVPVDPPVGASDTNYSMNQLGPALVEALAEIAEKRPTDPIEFLAHWLYKHRENMDYHKEQASQSRQLQREILQHQQDMMQKELLASERREFREEERQVQREKEEEERKQKEIQKKAKEQVSFAHPPDLPTVKEEDELSPSPPEHTVKKDSSGRTELHRAAETEGSELVKLLEEGYNIAERDINGRTARDVAEAAGRDEHVQAIDKYVLDQVAAENMSQLQRLALDGYQHFPAPPSDRNEEEAAKIEQTLNALHQLIEKSTQILHAAEQRDTETMKQLLDRKVLALSRDASGQCPLHKAVVNGSVDMVEYLATDFPASIECKDNHGRTALHYAKAVSEEISELLIEAGASDKVADVAGHNPDYFRDHIDELGLTSTTTGQAADQQQQNAEHLHTEDDDQADDQQEEVNNEQVSQEQVGENP